jgi:glycosyltransferase involved in cell wall biosynthesis
MRILAHILANNGVSFHRMRVPLSYLPEAEVVMSQAITEEQLANCDIFLYNRTIPDQGWVRILDLKKKHGFRIGVDIDDYWILDKAHLLHEEYLAQDFERIQIENLSRADFVTTTHARLAAKIFPYNPNVYVLPNAIPKVGQFIVEKTHDPYCRFFWQGSIMHQADIEILIHPLDMMSKQARKMRMVIAGYHEEDATWDAMARAYTANLKHQYKIIPSAPVQEYYAAYAHADVCLVPLVRSTFNGMKSNLKVLEAANLGLPVIASKVDPYMELPVNYCSKASDWVGHMRRLLMFPNRREDEGQRLKEFCDREFNFNYINDERRQVYEYQLSKA